MDRYDYVIVGAGSAGCVLAGRLSQDPSTSVLLIEAGPNDKKMEVRIPAAFPKLFKGERDWDYATVPQKELSGRELYWPRGRMLGGSSSINAQMYVRGNRADFDEWAALGNSGWSWSDVHPYFRRMEHGPQVEDSPYGCDGPLFVSALRDPSPLTEAAVAACVQSGIPRIADVNGPAQDGVAFTSVTQRRGRRWSAADAYLRSARRRPNTTILTGALASRVVFDGRRAVGVQFQESSGARVEVAADREVILSGGSINSPQLLLLSGIGPADHLAEFAIPPVVDLPGVGHNLQDHLAVPAIFTVGTHPTLLSAEKPGQLIKYVLQRKGMLTSNVGEAMAFVRTEPSLAVPDLQIIVAPVEYIDHGLAPPPGHGITLGVVLLRPTSVGSVRLRSSDPRQPPLIEPGYLADRADMGPLIEGVKMARRIASQPALSRFVDGELWPGPDANSDADIEEFIRNQAFTLYHPVGTCKMGIDPGAVVDPQLRVRGVEGLRVVDASIMPVITRGNTNAPTIMAAERASDLITST